LLCTLDNERCSLGLLLGDLLGLDSLGKLGREGDMGNSNIVQDDVELACTVCQLLANETADLKERKKRVGEKKKKRSKLAFSR